MCQIPNFVHLIAHRTTLSHSPLPLAITLLLSCQNAYKRIIIMNKVLYKVCVHLFNYPPPLSLSLSILGPVFFIPYFSVNVAWAFSVSLPATPPSFLPLVPLFVFLCRTPNTSSNGNPGYESLHLSDRQSPPPSVSSPVCVPSS